MPKSAYATLIVACLLPTLAVAALQRRYDREYEVIQYEASTPTDAVARLQDRIDAGDVSLRFDARGGYLASLLEALDIDVASQMLVFSKTSLQVDKISPATPRVIYFNDDAYVAWVQGGLIEISSVDPKLGAVFYTLEQDAAVTPRFERRTIRCLECHDTYALTGGGVPRHLVGSGFIGETGALASHEGWFLTTDQSPLRRRWGGWYVTGTHGDDVHMGNLIIRSAAQAASLDLAATGNVTDLTGLVNTDPYLSGHSDIVALLVLEHQTSVQNVITRVNWDTRRVLHNESVQNRERGLDEDFVSAAAREQIESIAEPLVGALLLSGEAPLHDPIVGTSGFREHFEGLGPDDTRGRSLRHLDLTRRLFRYPCSYLIYSEAFDALPDVSRGYVYRRLDEVLNGRDISADFDHLSGDDRAAILEILEDTKSDFAARRRPSAR